MRQVDRDRTVIPNKLLSLLLLVPVLSTSALAHEGKPHDFGDLLYTWSFDPLIIAILALSLFVYVLGVRNLWRSSGRWHGIGKTEIAAFSAAWFSMCVALVSPLHPWGEVLFAAHMSQHELLMLVSAPLFVIGRPFIAAMWCLPLAWRRPVGSILNRPRIKHAWRWVTAPFVAWAIHAVALWVWHIPALFEATLRSDFIHAFQHASFFLSALLFWWAINYRSHCPSTYGAGVLYLFTTSIHSGLLGVLLTLTSQVWYPAYSGTTASWGLTPLEDQQLGGLIMWIPAGIVYIVAALFMFASWLRESERQVRIREAALFATAKEM